MGLTLGVQRSGYPDQGLMCDRYIAVAVTAEIGQGCPRIAPMPTISLGRALAIQTSSPHFRNESIAQRRRLLNCAFC